MMWNHICVTAAVVLAVTVAVLVVPRTVALVTAPAAQQVAPKLAPATGDPGLAAGEDYGLPRRD